ncbi:hypothetical protein CLV77_1611 [Brevirhabdus pacifica]|uniref:hypothetical protein n=1 Tax=Brevirhabdus pacifica TaxID=1267768 RepID=UPI000C1BB83F|nr:hypothetical protein [Brevirhabdus pacifica]PJJ87047.1 hypothetical protein CLV77_1611 [Brevirhabdus pacifica]
MIVILGVLIGAIWGFTLARRRGGNRLDMAQYATGFAIAFGTLGMILTIVVERMV